MKSNIYHAPIGEGQNRIWLQLEQLKDDDDVGAGYIIKATLAILAIAACFAAVLCVCNPFYR